MSGARDGDVIASRQLTRGPIPAILQHARKVSGKRLSGHQAMVVLLSLSLAAPACGEVAPASACGHPAGGIEIPASLAYTCAVTEDGSYTGSAIFVFPPSGHRTRRLSPSLVRDSSPAWSPDGTRIAFTSTRDGASNLYVMRADGSDVRRLTDGPADDSSPAWSPDGREIVFASGRAGVHGPLGPLGLQSDLYVVSAGGGSPRQLTHSAGFDGDPAWSPDGTRIAFISDRNGLGAALYVMDGWGGSVRRITPGMAFEGRPSWSPDGDWIAFHRTRAEGAPLDTAAIFAVSAWGGGERRVVRDGYDPAWSPDGSAIAFVSGRPESRNLYLVRLSSGISVRLTEGGQAEERPAWQPIPS